MEEFIRNLEVGEIHIRDKRQFELKSEFLPSPKIEKNRYVQEFYFFIPNALGINEENYKKERFYEDLTNLIRYKTPEFELNQLCDEKNALSPLSRLNGVKFRKLRDKIRRKIEYELKLLGNIFRSSIRNHVLYLIKKREKTGSGYIREIENFCTAIATFRNRYFATQNRFLNMDITADLKSQFIYVDEFLSSVIDYYLTGFVAHLDRVKNGDFAALIQKPLEIIVNEENYRKNALKEPWITEDSAIKNEYILYRKSLLNKFVIDPLLLNIARSSIKKRLQHITGAISAGIAMLFFFVLFIWQGQFFLINSLPFILITVFLYIIKDRIKEAFKGISYKLFARLFSDYRINIYPSEGKPILGKISEYFSFVEEDRVAKEIIQIRNREFHTILETFKRPEKIIFYKKTISLFKEKRSFARRRQALNIISRFNISRFLRKADNAIKEYLRVDPATKKLSRNWLPKVYHLNIIMKNSYLCYDGHMHSELKKFRVILDKNGIKRVEHLHNL